GHQDQEQAEQEGPERDPIRACLDLRGRRRPAPARRNRPAGDLHRAAFASGHRLDRTLVPHEVQGTAHVRLLRIRFPQFAGLGLSHLLSFSLPAGLAVGLALKEMRYAATAATRPRPYGLWFPHALAGLGCMNAGHCNRDLGRIQRPATWET